MAQSIGANIKAKRLALGLKQEELAAKLGLTQANISRIEASVKGPSADMLLSVSKALGCDVRVIMGVKDMEEEGGGHPSQFLDEDAKEFVLNIIKGDPQLGTQMRSFADMSMTDEDWRFLASNIKLSLGYAADAIKAGRLRGNF